MLFGEMMKVPLDNTLVNPDVFFGWSVTRLAGYSQFAGARFENLRLVIGPGLPGGSVTINTVQIPGLVYQRDSGVAQEGVVKRGPTLVGDQPHERKKRLPVAAFAGHPINLHLMRTGEQ